MNNVRLVCGGVSVDLPSDFGILINKSIADIREPESRSSDWSKTFTLPGTKANNKLFTHLFDLNLSIRNTTSTNFSPDFNPNLKADAILQVDEVTQIEGFIRLLGIKINDLNQIEYECSMHGELADLFAKVADAKLADLDFTAYNHIISDTNIFNSWDTSIIKNSSGFVNFSGGAPIGEGYVYGWIDNGTYPDYRKLYTDDMTPYLYAKTVVDKIFSGAGYTYTSGSYFNTQQFRRLAIPCPTQYPFLSQQQVQDRQFEAKSSGNVTLSNNQQILFPVEITDPSNQYDTGTSKFTNDYSGQRYDFFFVCKLEADYQANTNYQFWYGLYVNGVRVKWLKIDTYTVNLTTNKLTVNLSSIFSNIKLNAGEEVTIKFEEALEEDTTLGTGFLPYTSGTITQLADSKFLNGIVDGIYGYGETLDFAGFFNGVETKQREFMRDIFTMFNLYIESSGIDKELVILPRDQFYTTTVRDWTRKRDLSQPLEITPMGELEASRYLFTYKEGGDEGNKDYKDNYSRVYGDRQILVENDFVKETKKIETGFVPTIIVKAPNEVDKYFPDVATSDGKQQMGDLRILQYKPKACQPYRVANGSYRPSIVFLPTFVTKTIYPYMGHLDDPLASTTDINFGLPRFIGLPPNTPVTNNNLFNGYWSSYLQEVTDKDSKIVRGSFYLTPADMEKLSFRDLYFFDNNYFRLNKIEDYDPINPSVNICEFLFLKSGPTFTATTGSVGGGGSQGGGDSVPIEKNPKGGGTSFKIISQRGFDIGEYNDIGDGVVVGDAVTNYGRANCAFATSGVTFLPDTERSIVIGEGVQNVRSEQVWLQGHLMTQNNFSTNRIELTAATSVTADLYVDIYIMDLTANTTLNLPDATTCRSKAYYVYKNSGSHQLIINPYEAQTIDDGATYTITNHYECVQIVSDGTQWRVISKK